MWQPTCPGTSGYPRAASELLKLVHLPFVVNTPVQMQAGAAALFEALNSFFSTDGLYDVNAPSANPAAFVATLQLEARIGTIQVVADPIIGTAPSNYPDAISELSGAVPARVQRGGPFPSFIQRYVRVQADNLEYRHLLHSRRHLGGARD